MTVKTTAVASGLKFESNELTNTIKTAETKITLTTSTPSEVKELEEGTEKMDFSLEVGTNLLEENLKNVEITCELPEGVTYKSSTVYPENVTFSIDGRVLKWTTNEMTENIDITMQVSIDKFSENDIKENRYTKNIPIVFKAKSEQTGSKEFSEGFDMISYRKGYEITQTSNISEESSLKVGQEIKYIITVKNLAPVKVNNIKVVDELSKNLTFVKYEYEQNGELKSVTTNRGNNDVKMSLDLAANETLSVTIFAKANQINTKAEEVINRAKLVTPDNKIITAKPETIEHILLGGNGEEPEKPDDPNKEESKYTIAGTAWLDKNKDGRRDDKEELLSNIKVYLLDSEAKNIIKETTTSETGAYVFDELKFGSYIVAFEYDNIKYDLTTYQADNVDVNLNSDVINMDLKLKEEIRKVCSNKYNSFKQ